MTHYFDATGMTGKGLARRAGVSHSQVYMARKRNIGSRNASKIARAVANILGLSGGEELELKAEIMGETGNLAFAYLGNSHEAAERLGEGPKIGLALASGSPLSHRAGRRVLAALKAMDAPEAVIESVRATVQPPPPSPPGRVTSTQGRTTNKEEDRKRLREAKPRTAAAVEASGLSRRQIYERAGVGKETLRSALYRSCSARSARLISEALAGDADLSEDDRRAIEAELLQPPE